MNKFVTEIMNTVSEVYKPVIEEATKSLMDIFTQRQDQFENTNNLHLDKIEEVVNKLLHQSASKPHSSPLTQSPTSISNPHVCTTCGEATSSAKALKIHTRSTHKPHS